MPKRTERDMHEAARKKSPQGQDKAFAEQAQGVMGIRKPGGEETVPERQSNKAKPRRRAPA